jgi:hypothetical protein
MEENKNLNELIKKVNELGLTFSNEHLQNILEKSEFKLERAIDYLLENKPDIKTLVICTICDNKVSDIVDHHL